MNGYLGLSDLASSMQLQRQNASVKSAVFKAGEELSSGKKSIGDIAKAGDVQRIFGYDHTLTMLDRFKQSADAGRVRLESMQTILGQIRDAGANVSLGVLNEIQGGRYGPSMVEARGAISALETVVSLLNQNVAGQSLFSGAATDRAALVSASQIQADVDAIVAAAPDAATALTNIDFYFNNPAGGFATTAYTGSVNNGPDIRIGENELISVPIRADDVAIREAIRNLTVIGSIANGGFAGSTTDQRAMLLDGATTNLNTSDSLIKLREMTGYDQERLERAVARNEAERSQISIARVDVANVDPYETASRFQELQIQLEKMFTVTARLSQLTLTNFLR